MVRRALLLDIKDAWKSLARRPLRSLLSSLGIGIGVTALIAMLSISEGAKKKAFEKIRSLGTSTLRVESSLKASPGKKSIVNLSQGIHQGDSKYLSEWLGSRGKVGAYVKRDNVVVSSGSQNISATVLGVNAKWFDAEKTALSRGRLLDESDIRFGKNYCVIGNALASRLQVDVLSTLQFDRYPATVIGVLAPKGRLLTEGTGLSALDFDNSVVLPISAMPFTRVIAGRLLLDGMVISLNTRTEGAILSISDQVETILLGNHRQVGDFRIVVPFALLEEAEESQKVFSFIMGAIAGLSLLVGGIGVMNVMLANIAEQTREIGLRMAVGASRGRIISLYLWNSILLTLSGGVWGVISGVLLALLIQHYAGWEVVFSTFSIVVAPLSAIATGIIFGVHPAFRAASLDPAQALRDS
jgi:putative ABC transport system permease protein